MSAIIVSRGRGSSGYQWRDARESRRVYRLQASRPRLDRDTAIEDSRFARSLRKISAACTLLPIPRNRRVKASPTRIAKWESRGA